MKHYEVRLSCDFPGCTNSVQSNGFTKPQAALEHAIQTAESFGWDYFQHQWWCNECTRKTSTPLVSISPFINREGDICGLCDGTHAHEHQNLKCTVCGVTGLAENIERHVCTPRKEPYINKQGNLCYSNGEEVDPIGVHHDFMPSPDGNCKLCSYPKADDIHKHT